MAYWQNKPKYQHKTGFDIKAIALNGGINRNGTIFNINQNEAWDCRNTTSKVNGALSVKPSDTAKVTKNFGGTNSFNDSIIGINSYTTNIGISAGIDIINLLVRDPDDNKYYILRYNPALDIVSPKEITQSAKRQSTIISYQTDSEDYTIIANDGGVYETHGSDVTLISNAPKTALYTVDDYRLFALRRNVLSWCDPDDITNWTTGDAGQLIITDMAGYGTAAITLRDTVIVFSGKTMHILYGDDTGNFFLGDTLEHGCVGFRAVAKKDDAVFFLDFDGLKVYNSGVVETISEKIDYFIKGMYIFENITNDVYSYAAMGINDDYLYLSIPYGITTYNNLTFEINLKTGAIHLWNEGYSAFTKVRNKFYGVKSGGLYEIGTKSNHTDSWYYETPMLFLDFNKQTVSTIPVLVDLPTGSTLKLAFNINDKTPSWSDIYTFTPSTVTKIHEIDLPMSILNNVDAYQLKFYGTGPCTIHYIGTDGRVKIR